MTRSISGGILNIDKPYGMTSMQVVRRVKRAGSFKRVGHAGTLDPIATGVVPVCFGPATRVMEYLLDGAKRYSGEIHLGVTTDTYDAMGQVAAETDASAITSDQVRDALAQFRGEILQVPPMYSALKRDGKRLYELARKGIEVEREPRPVSVYGIELTGWKPPSSHRESGLWTRLLHALAGSRRGTDAWLRRPPEVPGAYQDRTVSP